MRPLCTREDRVRSDGRSGSWWGHAYLDALVAHELQTGASVFSATPILPKKRLLPDCERMQKETDLARLRGLAAIPLALLAQRTGTTTANTGRIDHTQAPIGLATPLMGVKRLSSRTAQCPIGLERKVWTSEAASFPGRGRGGWSIPRCWRGGS